LCIYIARNLGGESFAQHGKDQLQIIHMVVQIVRWFIEALEFLVFGRCHAESSVADFDGELWIFDLLQPLVTHLGQPAFERFGLG